MTVASFGPISIIPLVVSIEAVMGGGSIDDTANRFVSVCVQRDDTSHMYSCVMWFWWCFHLYSVMLLMMICDVI